MSGMIGRLWAVPRTPPPPDDALTRVELARVQGTLESLVREVQGYRDWVNAELLDHEKRIRRNEAWRLAMPATIAVSVITLVLHLFGH